MTKQGRQNRIGRKQTRSTIQTTPLELLKKLRVASPKTIWAVAREIAAPHNKLPVPRILWLLGKSRSTHTRSAIAWLLGLVGDRRAIPRLEKMVADKQEAGSVRGHAAEALAHLHRKQTIRVLVDCLADRSKEVRFWCAYALGEIGAKAALLPLKQLARNDQRVIHGFGTIGAEARSAIRKINRVNRNQGHSANIRSLPHP